MTPKPTKPRFLERVADDNGVAIVILDREGRERSASNNNSICRTLWNSTDYRPECEKFCGRAFERAHSSSEESRYVCHAGLTCEAVAVADKGTPFVAIVGRTFLESKNYRAITERAITGNLKKFRPTEFFENILMAGSDVGIRSAIKALARFIAPKSEDVLELDAAPKAEPTKSIPPAEKPITVEPVPEQVKDGEHAPVSKPSQVPDAKPARPEPEPVRRPIVQPKPVAIAASVPARETAAEASAWRSLFGSLMKLEYRAACRAILDYLTDLYGFDSIVWLDRRQNLLVPVIAVGALGEKSVRLSVPVNSKRLADALKNERPLILRERRPDVRPVLGEAGRGLALFPVTVGSEVRSGFAVEPYTVDHATIQQLTRFGKAVGPQIEILRLRDEVSRRDWVSQGVRRFSDSLKRIDTDDFWMHLTQVSAELLQAERASLLVRSGKSDSLYAKASIGTSTDLKKTTNIGSRIARHTLDQGDPVIVSDMAAAGLQIAPSDWRYKTQSFISFPILIGDRRIAVMNFTDRAGGEAFSERDIELLQTIAPQIAVAIDRTELKDRAGEFEQLSVTDALTGLLNRRYLDERLDEELTRARRHHTEMSLMMIDVDNFKSYNDSFGHTAGDVALTMVAAAMKDTLRADDVAARFGGEEFAILLPRTNIEEAASIAERIRLRVEHTRFPNRQITISIGIAGQSAEFETPKDWITAADMALYEAKHLGRNNVQVYEMLGRSFKGRIN